MTHTNENRILIVDDVDTNRFVLKEIIEQMGFFPILTENGAQALEIVKRFPIKLVILDIAMPVMDGYEFCRILKADPNYRDIPIIFISAFDNPSDVVKGLELGGADYITKPFIPKVVKARVALHMRLSENSTSMQEMNRKLQISVHEQIKQIERERKSVLYALIRVARENAGYDTLHMERLARNCRLLAEAMQLTEEYEDIISDSYIETLESASPLCDLGNVAVPTPILQKRDYLNAEEQKIMQTHTQVADRILGDIEANGDKNAFISMSREIAHYHHENWDGTGYPEGISGDNIPLSAQIVAVAGAYSSLTENRTYRSAYSKQEALDILAEDAGKKYNPILVEILRKISRQLKE